jgi:hypothetical protein
MTAGYLSTNDNDNNLGEEAGNNIVDVDDGEELNDNDGGERRSW